MIDDPLRAFFDPESYSEPPRLTLILAVEHRINCNVAKTVVAIESANGLLVLPQKCFTITAMPYAEGHRRRKHTLPNGIGIEIFIAGDRHVRKLETLSAGNHVFDCLDAIRCRLNPEIDVGVVIALALKIIT